MTGAARILGCVAFALAAACASSPGGDPALEGWIGAERRYAEGLRDASVDALVDAARRMARHPARVFDGLLESEPGLPLGPSSEAPPASVEAALAAARELAAPDPEARARVEAAARELPSSQGPGPRRAYRQLGVGARDLVHWSVRAGEVMEVVALGDGRADLHMEVVDDHDGVVCDADGGGATGFEARCRWSAEAGRLYDVVVRNAGRSATRYVLLVR